MKSFPPTIVLRHRKENLKKCSLRGLESRKDFLFYTYPNAVLPNLDGYILLTLEAPPLNKRDFNRGLFIVDATWRHAANMIKAVDKIEGMIPRSIPDEYRTAYPRRQNDCPDPTRGLASIEAIFIAYRLLGRDVSGLLENYYWEDDFLKLNRESLTSLVRK